MSQDTELRRSLHEAARLVAVPTVDVDQMRASGRREARRRRAFSVAAAAAVLAVVVGSGVALTADDGRRATPDPVQRTELPEPSFTPARPAQPATVADLRQGGPPALPYVRNGTLYSTRAHADMEGAGRLSSLVVGGGVTLAVNTVRGVVRVDPIGDQIQLGEGVEGRPVVSDDGSAAAWLLPGNGRARVQLWDLIDRKPAAQRTLPVEGVCCDAPVIVEGVDAQGRVFVSGPDGTFMWDSASDRVVRVGVAAYTVSQVLLDGLVLSVQPESKGAMPEMVLGRVSDDGSVVEIQTVRGREVQWAPDMSRPARVLRSGRGATQPDGYRIEVLDPSTGDWRPMLVPSQVHLAGYTWEDSAHLLVAVHDQERWWWVRCAVVDGVCELAADLTVDDRALGGRLLPEH